jgi:hypothetical protein
MPVDLSAVAAIFNQCIDAIREEELQTPDYKKLEEEAVEALKSVRYNLMKMLEAK